ncbi:DUF1345 domain-containing protein [Propioniciclava soli]|uniref:DUF1345 domain-containing protein n=1 Tax=Propioniciclava soli TaxID=2775081 RepID=UPI001E3AFC14|nr:DUF1345 domain-containing protein [Propioniciclava soli]
MRPRTRPARIVPFCYDDGVRGGIPLGVGVAGFVAIVFPQAGSGMSSRVLIAGMGCAVLIAALGAYLIWTHHVFTRTDPAELSRIGKVQYQRGPSPIARLLGLGSTENWAISVAVAAVAGAIAAAVLGTQEGGTLLTLLALFTAAIAWTTVVYAFALRYFRLHSAGELFAFDTEDQPRFVDFLTVALMISSAGALSAATPTTRASLGAVRTHTVIAFAFNALVIAMTVSLISGLIATFGGSSQSTV